MLMQALVAASLCLSPVEPFLEDIAQLQLSSAETTRIYFVRHGESIFNVLDANGFKTVSGRSLEIPLTDQGVAQAKYLGKELNQKLPSEGSFAMISSTALRAQHTADLIFEQLQQTHEIERSADTHNFCELGHPGWEGTPKDEKYEQIIAFWDKLSSRDKFLHPKMPGGEHFQEVAQRVLSGLEQVVEEYAEKTILVVSHAAALNALAMQLNGGVSALSEDPGSPLPSINLNNCSLLQIEWEKGTPIEEAKVIQHIRINKRE
jgi:broad specificity phosphatase PhoE